MNFRLARLILRKNFLITVAALGWGGGLGALPPGLDPAIFPGADARPAQETEYAGLSVLYPGRVLREAPVAADPANAGRAPLVAELPRGVAYLRVYDLAAALPKIVERLARPGLIVDLRFVYGDEQSTLDFEAALHKSRHYAEDGKLLGDRTNLPAPVLALSGGFPSVIPPGWTPPPPVFPLIVLVNKQTAGPLEGWLAMFQANGSVLAVGTNTAGQPGTYKPVEGVLGYYVMISEDQPASGSVAGTGLKPRFPVEVTPEQSYRAYFAVERGADVSSLLRHEPATGEAPSSAVPGNPPAPEPAGDEGADPVLQRAVDVVAALQLLGSVPSLPTTAPTPAQPATTQP